MARHGRRLDKHSLGSPWTASSAPLLTRRYGQQHGQHDSLLGQQALSRRSQAKGNPRIRWTRCNALVLCCVLVLCAVLSCPSNLSQENTKSLVIPHQSVVMDCRCRCCCCCCCFMPGRAALRCCAQRFASRPPSFSQQPVNLLSSHNLPACMHACKL